MGGQAEYTNQQHQHCCTIFNVVVQLAGHTTESQQTHHLQRAEEAADALEEIREVILVILVSCHEDDVFTHIDLQYSTITTSPVLKGSPSE